MYRILFTAFFVLVSNATFATQYYLGVAKTNITPKKSMRPEVCMGGYGSPFEKCGLTEVNDRLSVRTLAISDKDTTMIISTLDAVGLSKQIIRQIKDKAYKRLHISPDKLFISATHSHSSADLQGVWGGSSEQYQNYVVKKVIRSIRKAIRSQERVKIYVSSTFANVENRRGWDEVDDTVNILDFVSKHSKERVATLVNMSAHPTIIPPENTKYSSGYVHYLREEIEDELGGITVFINGAVGDAQAATNGERGFETAKQYAELISDNVVNAVEYGDKVKGDFSIKTATFTHPVTNPLILGGIQAGLIDLDLTSENILTTKVSYFNFGNMVQGVTFPGEALTRLAIPIKQALTANNKFFFGLTNDTLGYFLPSDEFLQIDGRTTEESASIDPLVGDKAKAVLIDLIQE